MPSFDILLPVGISFYVFQALGYTIDVYRGDIKAERNFLKYALFVSFFPQLVAGPIERSSNLLGQFDERHHFSYQNLRVGMLWILWGYLLKLVIADRAAIFVDVVYGDTASHPGFYLVAATVLFGIQIYCDFNGYTMIARGCAKIMGFQLMENFSAPYLSKSVGEFWRRWHISLSSWFKDYLYIPLGGNRKGKIRKYINLLLVFGISGLWHGAGWGYIIWGGLNGIYQVIGQMLMPGRKKIMQKCHIREEAFSHRILQVCGTFLLIDCSWIFFRAKSIHGAFDVIKNMFCFNPVIFTDGSFFQLGVTEKDFGILLLVVFLLVIADVFKYYKIDLVGKVLSQGLGFRILVYLALFWIVMIYGIYGTQYDASAFIYFQF